MCVGDGMMADNALYQHLMELKAPWVVERVEVSVKKGRVDIWVGYPKGTRFPCPECQGECGVYDQQERVWRHLDSCQFQTFVHARVPRVDCSTHGAHQVVVPWAEPGSQFTKLFERLAIDLLRACSIQEASEILRITWDEARGIMDRAGSRGQARKSERVLEFILKLNQYHGLLSVIVSILLVLLNLMLYRFWQSVYDEPKFVLGSPWVECRLKPTDTYQLSTDYLSKVLSTVPAGYEWKACVLSLENEGAPASDVSLHMALREGGPFIILRIAVYDQRTKIALPSTVWSWRAPPEQTEPHSVSMIVAQLLGGEGLLVRLDLAKKPNVELLGQPCAREAILVIVRSPQVKTTGRALLSKADICWN
jgi:hypothetical protein